ncbi:MAG: aminopeptidase P family protein, partial [Proteobacteria bacterium]|nr:aminopeptidase P family protein [Pseudomonadota bacterium]
MSTTAAPPTLYAERLASLREHMRRLCVDGFVVPRADEHQGEYVPPRAMRLAWLSGFTGSAGAAVVLLDQAALFVDGRYTLQARQEVDGTLFGFEHLIKTPPSAWLGKTIARGARIGFDPWLHTPDGVSALRASVEAAGGELVALDENPIDAAWSDQPGAAASPVTVHEMAYAGRSSAEKRADLAEALRREHLDAAVISAPDAVAWLLNVRGTDVECTPLPLSFAIIEASGAVTWFIAPERVSDSVKEHVGDGVRIAPRSALLETLDAFSGRRVRVDGATAPFAVADRLTKAGAKVLPGLDPCALPRACKNPVELEGARAAHRRDAVAMCRFLAWLSREAPGGGLTEIAASDRLEALRRESPEFRDLSFNSISGAGSNGAIVHYRATPETQRVLTPGELYLIDSGAQYPDGTTDITRTLAIGIAPREAAEHFTLVLKGHIALAQAVFPVGTGGVQLDAIARRPLWERGLDYDHGTGHGVGSYLSVHEGPQRIAKQSSGVPLAPGM